ncbi:ammonia-forming cytochrome c nitrite reductase subunit c552 [Ectothiorhodospira variabilis]|uniref:ammonia-forming cytochrome c nitrite reductase subunit c552 n=1 Tax=Ectothiorhodospira variabilis TaxID=505694 RepID=UPI001EFC29CF|nr:ammonia-forming cytochrome c nitrite reductase subunit c552 [Ectothiorhodospira variabilis]MCG5495079.1 ammonia-forming cytochrome c nitrite reductase subunit c552 [Ectothiorhodospira variabilis]MCG5504666.1 ammonia-forming cytochrome c nitrite reductase subunit c552 [Ectothiorhodospira variabilis]MCG5507781.1 ammonia-forming cytochrome c nitrite reductase subunit c552 [Ectothiorhodospira variabilis]
MRRIFTLVTMLLVATATVSASSEEASSLGEGNAAFRHLPQYESYLKNNDDTVMTEFGGSVPHRKHDDFNPLPIGYKHAQPYLKNLWLGYPFMYHYDRARGHTFALTDVTNTDRVNRFSEHAGLPATCWNCKTNTMPQLLERHGDDFWSQNFHDFREMHDPVHHTVGCTNCHDPADRMRLTLTSVPLKEALARQGRDWREASRDEMRSLVCAQCHVEYYFETGEHGVAAKPHLPWDKGMNPEDIYRFKADGDPERDGFKGQFVDWTHAVSKTPMIKAQHPEYEMFHDSVHAQAGVSCADCHMPRVRMGPATITSHHWTSPLKTEDMIRTACAGCHDDLSPAQLRERTEYNQARVWRQLNIAQEKSVRAHEAVRMAMEHPGVDEVVLAQAREKVRKGQWFWDYVSAENSAGAHNPVKALDTLASSQQYSDEAVQLAIRATGHAIAADLDAPIAEQVPPIREHGRKLQQDEAHLASHPWLEYLPLLPKAEKVWDGTERVGRGEGKEGSGDAAADYP